MAFDIHLTGHVKSVVEATLPGYRAFAARLALGLQMPGAAARLTRHQDGHFASCLKARTGGEHR